MSASFSTSAIINSIPGDNIYIIIVGPHRQTQLWLSFCHEITYHSREYWGHPPPPTICIVSNHSNHTVGLHHYPCKPCQFPTTNHPRHYPKPSITTLINTSSHPSLPLSVTWTIHRNHCQYSEPPTSTIVITRTIHHNQCLHPEPPSPPLSVSQAALHHTPVVNSSSHLSWCHHLLKYFIWYRQNIQFPDPAGIPGKLAGHACQK